MASLLTKLEPRLLAVAHEIRSECHADIGCDHALLPKFLLESGRVKRVIAVEKNAEPYLKARRALAGYAALVRHGDGFSVLESNEADSLSISGLGAERIIKILNAFPERLPKKLVLQANDKPALLRAWALESGFQLVNEQMVSGFWRYVVLSFEKNSSEESAYEGLNEELALAFGPILLKAKHPLLLESLQEQEAYYAKKHAAKPQAYLVKRLDLISRALKHYA